MRSLEVRERETEVVAEVVGGDRDPLTRLALSGAQLSRPISKTDCQKAWSFRFSATSAFSLDTWRAKGSRYILLERRPFIPAGEVKRRRKKKEETWISNIFLGVSRGNFSFKGRKR